MIRFESGVAEGKKTPALVPGFFPVRELRLRSPFRLERGPRRIELPVQQQRQHKLSVISYRSRDVALWHKADFAAAPSNVRFRGKSGHARKVSPSPLLTHSGHRRGATKCLF